MRGVHVREETEVHSTESLSHARGFLVGVRFDKPVASFSERFSVPWCEICSDLRYSEIVCVEFCSCLRGDTGKVSVPHNEIRMSGGLSGDVSWCGAAFPYLENGSNTNGGVSVSVLRIR